MSSLECIIRVEGNCYVVSLTGDFLIDASPATRRILFDCLDSGRPLLIDMSGVRFIDSSGIASLVEVYHCAQRNGVGFGLVSVGAGVNMVLKLVHLDKVFPIFETVEEGLCGIGKPENKGTVAAAVSAAGR